MADLVDGIARLLQDAGLVTYEPDGPGGDLFNSAMPPSPDQAVVLTPYSSGRGPDGRLGYDQPNLQVRVRGTTDPRVSYRRAEAIRDLLHGLGRTELADGTLLLSCEALQDCPQSMGLDEQRRHEHVVNYELEVRSVTQHRE